MSKHCNITGMRFERLLVKGLDHISKTNGSYYLVLCDCGKEKVVARASLVNGRTRSCGCLHKEIMSRVHFKHGLTVKVGNSPEYGCYFNMRRRCYDAKNKAFKNYGARGIKMSDEWLASFSAFFKDMGPRPSPKHSIERLDNNGPYCKENCEWRTRIKQANNQRRTVFIKTDAGEVPLHAFCYRNNIQTELVSRFKSKGFTVYESIEMAKKRVQEVVYEYYSV